MGMEKRQYLYVIRPPRPDFLTNQTEEETARVGEHFQYLRRLTDEGTVVLAGRCNDARFGIVVFEAGSEVEARRIMEDDPAVRAGVFTAELMPFTVALLRGS